MITIMPDDAEKFVIDFNRVEMGFFVASSDNVPDVKGYGHTIDMALIDFSMRLASIFFDKITTDALYRTREELAVIAERERSKPRPTEMEENDIFTFGQYKGETLENVIKKNPGYINWLHCEGIRRFSREILDRVATENYSSYQNAGLDYDRDRYLEPSPWDN